MSAGSQWNIQAPDGKVIQFPNEFSQADVEREMGKLYPSAPAPNAGLAPAAGPSMKMNSGEGPIASGLTSFESQLSNMPAGVAQFLKTAWQGFPQDTKLHEQVMQGKVNPMDETANALQKLNPIVRNTEGIDVGATAANLAPLAMGLRNAPEGTMGKLWNTGVEAGKTGARLADVATFERISKAAKAVSEGSSNIKSIWSAPTTPEEIAAQRYQNVPATGPTTPSITGKNPYAGPRIPPMEPVQSTTISQSGYHGDSQTMVVQFKNGNVYELRGVPKAVYDKYQQSESQGSFYSTNLKGRYETNKLGVVKPGAK